VAQAVLELSQLLGFIINSLNGSTVLVTADHGFIYQESPLDESDKSTLEDKPEGTLKAKKRYLLGRNLGATPKAWSGNTALTAGTSPKAAWISGCPRARAASTLPVGHVLCTAARCRRRSWCR
jgi:hypothetical protein